MKFPIRDTIGYRVAKAIYEHGSPTFSEIRAIVYSRPNYIQNALDKMLVSGDVFRLGEKYSVCLAYANRFDEIAAGEPQRGDVVMPHYTKPFTEMKIWKRPDRLGEERTMYPASTQADPLTGVTA